MWGKIVAKPIYKSQCCFSFGKSLRFSESWICQSEKDNSGCFSRICTMANFNFREMLRIFQQPKCLITPTQQHPYLVPSE